MNQVGDGADEITGIQLPEISSMQVSYVSQLLQEHLLLAQHELPKREEPSKPNALSVMQITTATITTAAAATTTTITTTTTTATATTTTTACLLIGLGKRDLERRPYAVSFGPDRDKSVYV